MTAETTRPAARFAPLDRLAAMAAFLLGLAAILGALGSQFIGGLVPCELCLEQRMPYYWGLPILAALIVLWSRIPPVVWSLAMAIVIALFVWGAYLGVYHSGVEWRWWAGPSSCTGLGSAITFDALGDLNAARVVPCDQVQFRFLGLSLAGYNALVSAGVAGLCAIALFARWAGRRG